MSNINLETKPIKIIYNINRNEKLNYSMIEHTHCYDTRNIEVVLSESDLEADQIVIPPNSIVSAIFVLNNVLLNDSVIGDVTENGTIMLSVDRTTLDNLEAGLLEVEVSVKTDDRMLSLPYPIVLGIKKSLINNAKLSSASQGVVPELVKEAEQKLEKAIESIENNRLIAGDNIHIDENNVISSSVGEGEIKTEHLADGAVTHAKLAKSAVDIDNLSGNVSNKINEIDDKASIELVNGKTDEMINILSDGIYKPEIEWEYKKSIEFGSGKSNTPNTADDRGARTSEFLKITPFSKIIVNSEVQAFSYIYIFCYKEDKTFLGYTSNSFKSLDNESDKTRIIDLQSNFKEYPGTFFVKVVARIPPGNIISSDNNLSLELVIKKEKGRLVNIEDYGAVPGDIVIKEGEEDEDDKAKNFYENNLNAFLAAVAAAKENGFDGVYIPNKHYYFNDTIRIEGVSNLKIYNAGTLFRLPVQSGEGQLFNFVDCNRITFDVGILNSNQIGFYKGPGSFGTSAGNDEDKSRMDKKTSNIVAFKIENCNNLTFRNGFIWNMEYAGYITVSEQKDDEDNIIRNKQRALKNTPAEKTETKEIFIEDVMSDNIVFKDLTIADTCQPFLINTAKNVEFNHLKITSRSRLSAGDHFLYICDCVEHIVVRDCIFTYTDACFGSAINLRNSWVQDYVSHGEYTENNPDGVAHVPYDVKNVEIYNTQVLNCPSTYFVTAKGESKVLIQDCKFEYRNLSLKGEAREVIKKELQRKDQYDVWVAADKLIDINSIVVPEPSTDEIEARAAVLENKRRAFLFGEKNQTQGTEITVTDTSIVEPTSYPQGQLISGFDRKWTADFRNCTIKSGSICSHREGGSPEKDSTPEDQTGAALEFHNCKMEFSRWMIVFRAYTKRVFKLLNCDIATRGDTYQIRTPRWNDDDNDPNVVEIMCIGCNFTNTDDGELHLFGNTIRVDGETNLLNLGDNIKAVNNTATGFVDFTDMSHVGSAILSNNILF